jgi:hypothetical protein
VERLAICDMVFSVCAEQGKRETDENESNELGKRILQVGTKLDIPRQFMDRVGTIFGENALR